MADVIHASEGFVRHLVDTKQGELREELLEEIGKLGHLEIRRVTTRPQTGESGVLYLVPSATSKQENIYDEYLWINGAWEMIGSTAVDLSGYVEKDADYDAVRSNAETGAEHAGKTGNPHGTRAADIGAATQNDIANATGPINASLQSLGDAFMRHRDDETIHVTQAEKTGWNNKQDKLTSAQLANIDAVPQKRDKTDRTFEREVGPGEFDLSEVERLHPLPTRYTYKVQPYHFTDGKWYLEIATYDGSEEEDQIALSAESADSAADALAMESFTIGRVVPGLPQSYADLVGVLIERKPSTVEDTLALTSEIPDVLNLASKTELADATKLKPVFSEWVLSKNAPDGYSVFRLNEYWALRVSDDEYALSEVTDDDATYIHGFEGSYGDITATRTVDHYVTARGEKILAGTIAGVFATPAFSEKVKEKVLEEGDDSIKAALFSDTAFSEQVKKDANYAVVDTIENRSVKRVTISRDTAMTVVLPRPTSESGVIDFEVWFDASAYTGTYPSIGYKYDATTDADVITKDGEDLAYGDGAVTIVHFTSVNGSSYTAVAASFK